VVYLGAVLAAPGCGSETEEPEETPEVVLQPYGAPPRLEDDELAVDPPEPEEPEVEEPEPDTEEDAVDGRRREIGSTAQPYGATPLPERGGIEVE